MEEEAILAFHRPQGCHAEQTYVVVRRTERGGQRLLIPHHTVILVSRTDLPLGDLVRGHRGKQGHEDAFKGPLRDLHHPPCRGYRANQGFYALGQTAHTLLRAVQFTALPKRAWGHGIRSVIRHVAWTVARMVGTGRRTWVRYAKTNLRLDWLYEAMMACEARAPVGRKAPPWGAPNGPITPPSSLERDAMPSLGRQLPPLCLRWRKKTSISAISGDQERSLTYFFGWMDRVRSGWRFLVNGAVSALWMVPCGGLVTPNPIF